ncbi:hypothetical protein K438DRAFT_1831561 [Mycena galopus ATCC 62051]|nr:hypothetical protein K438DRAFT_1831561 [Mycena galopus ATCC 62051]
MRDVRAERRTKEAKVDNVLRIEVKGFEACLRPSLTEKGEMTWLRLEGPRGRGKGLKMTGRVY